MSTAINIMRVVNKDEFAFRGIDRTIEDDVLPDIDEIVVTRVTPKRPAKK